MSIRQTNLHQSGTSMIEVLITLVILLVGLLGLAGVMAQSQRSEMESYQRAQALVLLQDMAGRINANRAVATCYAFTTNTGTGTPYVGASGVGVLATIPPTCATGTASQQTLAQNDISEWDSQLKGAAETSGGAKVGAMLGARGCISYDSSTALISTASSAVLAGTGIYTISVAWQGLGNTFANTHLLCGTGLYGDERQRRVASLTLRVGSVSNNTSD